MYIVDTYIDDFQTKNEWLPSSPTANERARELLMVEKQICENEFLK